MLRGSCKAGAVSVFQTSGAPLHLDHEHAIDAHRRCDAFHRQRQAFFQRARGEQFCNAARDDLEQLMALKQLGHVGIDFLRGRQVSAGSATGCVHRRNE
jgi:hypothetical protein